MKTVVFCFLLAMTLTNAFKVTLDEDAQWKNFKATYVKPYSTQAEEAKRKQIFLSNLEFIIDHNKKFKNGDETFDVAINEFADMTNEEFVQKMLTFKPSEEVVSGATRTFQRPKSVTDLPSSVDWRDEGAVTPIKNQGSCGSCWAFSATGSLEGQHFLSTGELVSLSEQNLVDCSLPSNRSGCDGSWPVSAFEYIISNQGIDTEASYPYVSKDGIEGTCQFNASNVGATMTGYVNITEGSETDLQAAVATVGPASVAIDAGHLSFQLYHSGVYKKWLCQKKHLNHAVLVVGYGTKSGKWLWDGDYWLVKNSWGTSWGEKGYILMARNHNNMCGIATCASYPLV